MLLRGIGRSLPGGNPLEIRAFVRDLGGLNREIARVGTSLRFFRLNVKTVNLSINVQTLRTLRLIGKKDVAVLLTFPPYYDSVKKMLDHFESRNIPVITITNNESSPAVTPYTMSFICPTLSRYYYNSQVATVSFVNLLAACIAEEMGPNFDRILKEERETSDFLINWFSDSNE